MDNKPDVHEPEIFKISLPSWSFHQNKCEILLEVELVYKIRAKNEL